MDRNLTRSSSGLCVVLRFFQHAPEEFQLAEFAVDEQLGIVQSRIDFEVFQVVFLVSHSCSPHGTTECDCNMQVALLRKRAPHLTRAVPPC